MSNNILRFKKDGKYVPVDVNAENVLLKNQNGEYTGENLEDLLGEYHNLEQNYTPRLNELEQNDIAIEKKLDDTTAQLAQNTQEIETAKTEITVTKYNVENTNSRIDNIIATPTTVSEQEIIDARQGATSLGHNLSAIKENIADIGKLTNILLNGNFTSKQYFPTTSSNFTAINYEGHLLATVQGGNIKQALNVVDGHTYYVKVKMKSNTLRGELVSFSGVGDKAANHSGSGKYETLSHLVTVTGTGLKNIFQIRDQRTSDWDDITIKEAMVVDVTGLFEGYTHKKELLDYVTEQWFSSEKVVNDRLINYQLKELANIEATADNLLRNISENIKVGVWATIPGQVIYYGNTQNKLRTVTPIQLKANTHYICDIELVGDYRVGFEHSGLDNKGMYVSGWFKGVYKFRTGNTQEQLHLNIMHITDKNLYPTDISNIKLNLYETKPNELPRSIRDTKVYFGAHRGAVEFAPENTVPAVEIAKSKGFDMVEFDVGFTSDGVAICLHDETVDRTTNGIGYYKDMTYAQIQELNVDTDLDNFPSLKVPTMQEMLLACKKTGIIPLVHFNRINKDIETDYFMDILKETGLLSRVIVTPPSNESAQRMRELSNDLYLSYLVGGATDGDLRACYRYGYSGVAIDMSTNPDYRNFITEAHKRGMTVSASVINEKYIADNLIAQGVDFIITDTINVL